MDIMLNTRSFASDNNSGIIPEVMTALSKVNHNHVAAYGNDPVTAHAQKVFKDVFTERCESYFAFNGTATNHLCLAPFVKPFESVICSEHSHLHQNECGAPERILGIKLLTLPSPNGKLKAQQIKECLAVQRYGDIHCRQPRMVSITQPTELGTVYSIEEMLAIAKIAKEYKLFFHIDGSRLVNAAIALNKSLQQITVDIGADCVSFGGTKNGLMLAEAALFFNRHNKQDIPYHQKQLLQLPGKSRFVAAQFCALLEENVWKKYANHANQMAQKLATQVANIKHIKLVQPVESNVLFAQIPRTLLKVARKNFFFYLWDENFKNNNCIVRWMTTFNTTQEDIDAFCKDIS